jgi:predicted nucleic acid-binding protein
VRYVLDASIAACWCFEDEHDPRADAAAALLLASVSAIAPLIFWFEVRNVVLMGMRRGRTSEASMIEWLARMKRAPITLDTLPAADLVFSLAQRHRLTFYDAAYLELAQREKVALATLDQALARAASAEAVPLIGA